MAERYWEKRTARHHSYIDGDTGQVLGTLYERLADRCVEARAYDRSVGEYIRVDDAQAAVVRGCAKVEAEALAAQQRAAQQADGAEA